MCWFYTGIAQISLDPPPFIRANVEKKVLQTILASLYTPPPSSGNDHMETTHQKGASLTTALTLVTDVESFGKLQTVDDFYIFINCQQHNQKPQ